LGQSHGQGAAQLTRPADDDGRFPRKVEEVFEKCRGLHSESFLKIGAIAKHGLSDLTRGQGRGSLVRFVRASVGVRNALFRLGGAFGRFE
jgi:hypothetical protein